MMQFSELISVAPNTKYSVFILRLGKFRQWVPKRYVKGITDLDQVGLCLRKEAPELMKMRVYSVYPTATGYANVKLIEGKN